MMIRTICFFIFLSAAGIYAQEDAKLLKFSQSSCLCDPNFETCQEGVLSQHYNSDTLEIEIGLIHDCCINMKGLAMIDKEILYLEYDRKGEGSCSCYCYYILKYSIAIDKDQFKDIIIPKSIINAKKLKVTFSTPPTPPPPPEKE